MPTYEKGKYKARITGQSFGKSKNEKHYELQVHFKPIGYYEEGGEFVEFEYEYERTIFLPITEKTMGSETDPGWVTQMLAWLGFRGSSLTELDPASDNCHTFNGMEPDVWCDHQDWEGKTREKWRFSRGAGERPKPKPVVDREVKALDKRLAGVFRALQSQPTKPAEEDLALAAELEEIPF